MDPEDELGFVADDAADGFVEAPAEVPGGYRETGARVLELPETTIAAGGPTTVAPGGGTEYREVAKVGRADRTGERMGPDRRGAVDRVREYLSGRDPEALGTGWRGGVPGQVMGDSPAPEWAGIEAPSLPSIRRAISADFTPGSTSSDVLNTLVPRAPMAQQPASGIDDRSLAPAIGATDALSFGWLDEIAGAVGGDSRRQAERARTQRAQDQAPTEYATGMAAGTAPLALVPGGAPTAAGRMAIAGGVGAGAGLLRGTGESDAGGVEALRSGVEGAALEGLIGAGTAGMGEAAAPLLGRLARGADELTRGLRQTRAETRLQAAGLMNPNPHPSTRYGRQLARLGGAEEVSRMLDEQRVGGRIVPTMADEDDLARLGARTGAGFEGVMARMDEGGARISRSELADRAMRSITGELGDMHTGPAQRAIQRMESDYAEPWRNAGRAVTTDARSPDLMDFRQAHRLRRQLDQDSGAFSRASDPTDVSVAGGAASARDDLNAMMNEALDSVDPALRGQWRGANRAYMLERLLADNARQSGSRLPGAIAEGVASATGNVGGAVMARAAGGIVSRYGAGLRVRALDAIIPAMRSGSPALQRAARLLESAQQRGEPAVAAAHYLLSRRSPEYRLMIENASEEGQEE